MKMAGSLDANVVLRLLLGDIPAQQKQALAVISSAPGVQFAVADTALIETIFVLGRAYGFNRTTTAAAIRDFMSDLRIKCNRAMVTSALDLYVRHPSLSFEDCVLATYAELTDALPLYTFDKKLAKATSHAKLVS